MSIRFTQGASMKATRTISQAAKVAPPQKNTMKGLPGFIKTTQDASDGGLKDKSGIGPKREGPIGKRAKPGGEHYTGKYADNGKFRGSSDKSYRATSTGPAGKVVSNKSTMRRPMKESEGPARGKPTSGFKQIGGGRGTMESLRGKARTSWEK